MPPGYFSSARRPFYWVEGDRKVGDPTEVSFLKRSVNKDKL
jgi:hypothetical protein